MPFLPDSSEIRTVYSASYAGLRIAQTLSIAELRQAVESRSINLLLSALDRQKDVFLKNVQDLEYILALSRDAGILHYRTAELMFNELQKIKAFNPAIEGLDSAIRQLPDTPCAPELNAKDLFPSFGNTSDSGKDGFPNNRSEVATGSSGGQETYLVRQSAIINFIRQSGNCRLRDLQNALPNVSERTLRYDLQGLVQKGTIERVGQSGPATHYRLREQ